MEIEQNLNSDRNIMEKQIEEGMNEEVDLVNLSENQIVKMMDSEQLKEIKIWLEFLKDTLAFYKEEKPRFYGFIRLKYFRKRSDEDIQIVMKLNKKEFKELKKEVIESIYIRAIQNGILKKR